MRPTRRQLAVIAVTAVRVPLAAGAAALLVIAAPGGLAAWAAVALLLAVEASDLLDGFLARRFGVVSRLGELLDPYCDSVSRLIVYFGLAAAGVSPWGLLLVLALRDVSVAYVRIVCVTTGRRVAARASGKLKAIIQGTAAVLLAASLAVPALASATWIGDARLAVVWLVGAVTLWSLVDYFIAAVRPRR